MDKENDHRLQERALAQKEVELFNKHQAGSRMQSEFLAKSIFLIAGTTLTLSINLFLGKDAPKLNIEQLWWLRVAWIALFTSIIGQIFVFGPTLIRDYVYGERWRKYLYNKGPSATHLKWPDVVMWIAGPISVVAFLIGLVAIAWLSSSLVGK